MHKCNTECSYPDLIVLGLVPKARTKLEVVFLEENGLKTCSKGHFLSSLRCYQDKSWVCLIFEVV